MIPPKKKRFQKTRRGSALVEFALVIPVMVLIIYGSIESCNLMYVQQALTETAYDGALRASRPRATDASVKTAIEQLLEAREITPSSIVIGDGTTLIEDLPRGQIFSVYISVNTGGHLISPKYFAQFDEVEVRVFARKQ